VGATQRQTAPAGRFSLGVMGEVATAESETMSLRLRGGYEGRVRRGVHVPKQRVYGYLPGNMKVNEDEATFIRELYKRVLDGETISEIVRDLNRRGFRSTKGNPLTRSAANVILRNPRYTGIQEHHQVVRDEHSREVARTQVRGVRSEGEWETIIDRETWRAMQLRHAHPDLQRQRSPTPKWLLAGIATCAECEFVISSAGGAGNRKLYVCNNPDPPTRHRLGRTIHIIDTAVAEFLISTLATGDPATLSGRPTNIANLEHEQELLERRADELADQWAAGMPQRRYERLTAALEARIDEIAKALGEALLADQLAAWPVGEGEQAVRGVWELADVPARKRVLRHLYDVRLHRVGRGRPAHPLEGVELTPRF
jgi:site-specific DNA recombinase